MILSDKTKKRVSINSKRLLWINFAQADASRYHKVVRIEIQSIYQHNITSGSFSELPGNLLK